MALLTIICMSHSESQRSCVREASIYCMALAFFLTAASSSAGSAE
jgi:hypothetical protein